MQVQGTAVAGTAPAGSSSPSTGARRNGGFALVLTLVLLALVPGLLLRLDIVPRLGAPFAGWLGTLDAWLEDIRFGSGLRFWLGVGGASLMLLPLLYPLRKLIGLARFVGVGAWFDLHVICGLLGPLLILYHCNLGLGSTPATVALVTMLIVVASGIVGHFFYARLSARYYGTRNRARDRLHVAIVETRCLAPGSPRDRFVEDLQRFDTARMEQQAASAAATGVTMAAIEHDFLERAAWLAATQASAPPNLRPPLQAYFDDVRRMERWRRIERLWAYWRLAHLPVFWIMVVAAGIHVGKVWGMDDAAPASVETTSASQATVTPRVGPVTVRAIRTVGVTAGTPDVKPAAVEPRSLPPPPAPRLVERRAAAAPATKTVIDAPVNVVPAPAAPAKMTPAKADGLVAIAELERRNEQSTRGTFEPSALLARLKQLKADNFDHGRTNFALTGKHATVKCESCHKAALKDTAKECVACHKKDDVHRGRRNDCAQCHVTTDWNRIVRRR